MTAKTTTIQLDGRTAIQLDLDTLRVEVLEGPDTGVLESFELDPVRIGTAPGNDLVLTDPSVSGRHAELRREGDRVVLRDLGSTNGLRVRGLKVGEVELDGELVAELGSTRLRIGIGSTRRTSAVTDPRGLLDVVGQDPRMQEVLGTLEAAAPARVTVLLQGETGTGKEVLARTLHRLSGRKGTFVVFDAASTQRDLVQASLFGHVRGAFTGADREREGAFRAAEGGTLFIDEVGELPLELQPNLLRVLENRTLAPVGSDRQVPVDTRVVAATHRDLEAMVREGTFRADLYHRLAVVRVRIPPLRERAGDVPALVEHFLADLGLELELSPAAMDALRAHSWPGNVRELRNVLESAAVRCRGRAAASADLELRSASLAGAAPAPAAAGPASAAGALRDRERETILAALERHGGNRAAAAKELGIARSTLWRKLKGYLPEG
jgi:DNA-binding NtrC family response regulator